MNEIAISDKNLSVDRTPQLIAIEINSIKEQTRKQVLFNSIEIGKRLAEAKIMLGHGEWGDWLKGSVDYSQRTASNLMGIFEQYGTSQINMFCENNAKSQALANLSYTQAVLLMGIPQDEREEFVEEHDVDTLSTRELQQAIKENQELAAKLKEVEASWEKDKNILGEARKEAESERESAQRVSDSYDKLEKTNKEHYEKAESLRKELEKAQASGNTDLVERLQESFDEADSARNGALIMIEELQRQINETPIEVTAAPVIEKIPEEVERELNELRAKVAQPVDTTKIRFKIQFDALVKGFSDLLGTLEEIKEVDAYKKAVSGLLSKMSERL